MSYKIEICKQCFTSKLVNAKSICSDCTFRNNHDGKSRQEIYSERSKTKEKTGASKTVISRKKPSKNTSLLKNERLEKRRETLRQDELFYESIFNSRPHKCEECGVSLPDQFRDEEGNVIYRSQYSHILSKGSEPRLRHHPLNINRLCSIHHYQWEFQDQTKMKIYESNQKLIQEMFDELNSI